MPLKFAANLTLPDDAVTQTFAWLGIKGSGKSYGAMKLAELMLAAGQQVVALDPVGIWYSLRLNAAGTGPSKFKLPILGGLRGDVPLDHRAGKTVATFLADTGTSAILDVSLFHKAKRKEFVADLAEELFHRAKSVRRPVHLFLEEAQMFAPQMAKGEERMLGAIEDIVRVGRNFGLGASMITQRPQSVNKEVLNQAEPLVVFRLIAKHERDAVKNWLEHVGAGAGEMMANLHALKTGECFFWSPAWMEAFAKTRALKRVTYDASSTPTGPEGPAAVELKAVDLGKLEQAMAKSIDEAKANDPKALRARVGELEKNLLAVSSQPSARGSSAADRHQLAKLAQLVEKAMKFIVQINAQDFFKEAGPGIDQEKVEKAIRSAMDVALRQVDLTLEARCQAFEKFRREGERVLKQMQETLADPNIAAEVTVKINEPFTATATTGPRVQRRPTERPADVGRVADGSLSRMQRAFLTALAQHPEGLTKQQLHILAGYSSNGATSKTFAGFGQDGWWEETAERGRFAITGAGAAALGPWEPLPKGDELRSLRLAQAPRMEQAILEQLFAAYPDALAKGKILEAAGYSSNGATSKVFAKLVRLEWATSPRPGQLRASDVFFE